MCIREYIIYIYIYIHIQDLMEYVQRYDAGLSPQKTGVNRLMPTKLHAKILSTMRFLGKSTWLKDATQNRVHGGHCNPKSINSWLTCWGGTAVLRVIYY